MNQSYVVKRSVYDGVNFSYLVMVALIYITQPSDVELKNISYYGLMTLALFALGVVVSFFLNKFKIKTTGESLFEPPYKKVAEEAKGVLQTFAGWQLIITLLVTIVVGGLVTEFSILNLLDEGGIQGARRLFSELLQPNMEILPRAVLEMVTTIFSAFMATIIAVPMAFVLSFLSAKNIMKHPALVVVYGFLKVILNIVRSIEAIIWAIIFSVWVGIGPFAGMLALMIHSVASLAKQYAEMIETIDEGPIEGVQSTGAGFLQTIWFGMVPQLVLPFISFTIFRWDINIRMATIVGLVGGGGIGKLLNLYLQQSRWLEVGCIVLVITVVVWAMDQASAYIREALK